MKAIKLTDLFPYQILGINWLKSRKLALLADEMGLGKSAQAITAADLNDFKRILILCPAVARINWEREFRKFSACNRSFQIVKGKNASISTEHSVISSYDLLAFNNFNMWGSFDLIILDEVHFLKSTTAKRTNNVFGRKGIIRHAKKAIWALSGTPAPNHAGELWPLLYSFGSVTASYDRFIETYCDTIPHPKGYGRQVVGTKISKVTELRGVLNTIMLRRKKQDVLKELPPIMFGDVVVEPGFVDIDIDIVFVAYKGPFKQELYDKLKKEEELVKTLIGTTGLGKDGMSVLKGLAQSVSTLRRYTGLQKIQAISQLVSMELDLGYYDKIVIFAIHQGVIEGLRRNFSKYHPVTLYGGTPYAKRQKNLDKFQNDPKCQIFIGNIQSCGTAVNLTASSEVLFAEQDWVPGNNAQAAMRCHRIGQLKPVNVRCVALANSYDERLSQILKRKTKELTELIDGEKT